MFTARFFKVLVTLVFGVLANEAQAIPVISSPAPTCFYKTKQIGTVPGAEHLPEKVCFDQLQLMGSPELMFLKVEGQPYSGIHLLSLIEKKADALKYMAFLSAKSFQQDEKTQMSANLRVSVDVDPTTYEVGYTYLAAEFFVFLDEGYDTHIYYYSRKPLDPGN